MRWSTPVICERIAAVRIGSTEPMASMTSGTTLRCTLPTITGAGPPPPLPLLPPLPPPAPPFAAPSAAVGGFSPQDVSNSTSSIEARAGAVWRKQVDIMESGEERWQKRRRSRADEKRAKLEGAAAVCQRRGARREKN